MRAFKPIIPYINVGLRPDPRGFKQLSLDITNTIIWLFNFTFEISLSLSLERDVTAWRPACMGTSTWSARRVRGPPEGPGEAVTNEDGAAAAAAPMHFAAHETETNCVVATNQNQPTN